MIITLGCAVDDVVNAKSINNAAYLVIFALPIPSIARQIVIACTATIIYIYNH